MSRSRHGKRQVIPGVCNCWLCTEPARKKAKALRRVGELDMKQQLTEVPDNVRVFDDFRELPDDIFDSHGDFWPCQCECCTRTWSEEEVA